MLWPYPYVYLHTHEEYLTTASLLKKGSYTDSLNMKDWATRCLIKNVPTKNPRRKLGCYPKNICLGKYKIGNMFFFDKMHLKLENRVLMFSNFKKEQSDKNWPSTFKYKFVLVCTFQRTEPRSIEPQVCLIFCLIVFFICLLHSSVLAKHVKTTW